MKIAMKDGVVSYDPGTDRWRLSFGKLSDVFMQVLNSSWQIIPDWPIHAASMLVYRAAFLSECFNGELSDTEEYTREEPGRLY
jgi:hypothetical protein